MNFSNAALAAHCLGWGLGFGLQLALVGLTVGTDSECFKFEAQDSREFILKNETMKEGEVRQMMYSMFIFL